MTYLHKRLDRCALAGDRGYARRNGPRCPGSLRRRRVFPGIEAGRPQRITANHGCVELPIVSRNYSEAFRLDHGVLSPGDITLRDGPAMAERLLSMCATTGGRCPVPTMSFVRRHSGSSVHRRRGRQAAQGMVDNWHKLGFVVRQGTQHVEVDRCDLASINLLTPLLNFQHVPQGPMGMVRETPLPITFEVISPSSAGNSSIHAGRRAC